MLETVILINNQPETAPHLDLVPEALDDPERLVNGVPLRVRPSQQLFGIVQQQHIDVLWVQVAAAQQAQRAPRRSYHHLRSMPTSATEGAVINFLAQANWSTY